MPTRTRIGGAVIAALSIGVLTALAVPTSASAHTGTLSASAECAADGTRVVTYTGSTTNVPETGDGHVATLTVTEIVPSTATITPATQTVTGDTTYSFTETLPGDATHASATASLAWGDGATSDPIGSLSFTEGCVTTPPTVADATASVSVSPATCEAPGSATFAIENATWDDASDTTDGSRTATAADGHVFADGASVTTVTYAIPPQLDADSPDCATADASASAAVTPATCAAPGAATFTIANATWDDATDTTDGSRTATAASGHRFADGSSVATVTYAIPAQLDPRSATCRPDVTPHSTVKTAVQCEDTQATVTTTTTTPRFALEGSTWVRGADQVTTKTTTRSLTKAEVASCPPVITVIDSPPSAQVPPSSPTTTTSATGELAYTGVNDDLPWLALAAALAMLAGAGIVVTGRIRSRRHGD